ncbi:sll1863 family stress response protein [Frigoriglobus tundricola]|uniref:Uncharacterized protein n=1 Tax=Frigoriglobus tundricola TaxID=2774151 RepID=A0A6M5YQA8_9BACT|nr:hypothetical protein [Frigoriglobus tundricola]QJW95431.1 hypothetical protein FTUN_2980 [Frigoriglobus tundricola]
MLRTCVLCCALAGVTGLTVGCTGSKDTKPTTSKDESVKTYKTQLSAFDKHVDELKAKAEKATGEEKTKLEAKWKESAAKRDAAKRKLEDLEKAAEDKWDAVNKEAATAFDDVKKAVKE